MDATKNAAHLGCQVVSDPVTRQPGSGAGHQRRRPVGVVWLRSDDDDPRSRDVVEHRLAATWVVARVNHQEIRAVPNGCVGEGVVGACLSRDPAAELTLEKGSREAPHRRVGDHQQHTRRPVTHRARSGGGCVRHLAPLGPRSV